MSSKLSWFPAHMHRAMSQLEKRLSEIDIFVEVRDARLPMSSFNKNIDNILRLHQKKKIVIFNKWDLCDPDMTRRVQEELTVIGIPSLKMDAKMRKLDMPELISSCRKYSNEKFSTVGMWMMVGGIPNVGKSAIVNGLRVLAKNFENNAVSKSSPKPCQTTHVTGFKVSANPVVYLVDTPGIFLPYIENELMAMDLGLIGTLRSSIIGNLKLIDHLYNRVGKQRVDNIARKWCLTTRPKSGEDLLHRTMEAFKLSDLDAACEKLLEAFREGEFGRITLDSVHVKIKH